MSRRPPGEVFRGSFRITLPILLTVGVAALTYAYARYLQWRDVIEFFGVAVGVAGGLQSAYYVGRTLRDTLEQAESELQERKLRVAFEFCQSWYGGSVVPQWRGVLSTLYGKGGPKVVEMLGSNEDHRVIANGVLTFFEQVGYAARVGRVDCIHLKQLMGTSIERNYVTLEPWIEEYRRRNTQPTFAEHFQWLRNELRNLKS